MSQTSAYEVIVALQGAFKLLAADGTNLLAAGAANLLAAGAANLLAAGTTYLLDAAAPNFEMGPCWSEKYPLTDPWRHHSVKGWVRGHAPL